MPDDVPPELTPTNLNAPPPDLPFSVGRPIVSTSDLPPPALAAIDDSRIRASISYWLLALLSATIVLAFVAMAYILGVPLGDGIPDIRFDQLIQLLNVVFGPIIALVSSVVGFYFGARTAADAKANT